MCTQCGPGAELTQLQSDQVLQPASLQCAEVGMLQPGAPPRTAGKAPTRINRVYATKMQEATGLFQIFYRTRSTYAGKCWASHAVLARCTHSTLAS